MASHIYPFALAALEAGTLDWTEEEIHVVFLGPSFIYDPSLVYASELPAQHIIATSELGLANRSYEEGVARGDPAAFLQLLSNQEITHVVVFQNTGDAQYSMLIAHWDADDILGAPQLPQGTDLFVYTPVSPGGWFQLLEDVLEGAINSYLISADVALAELLGGTLLVMPELVLGNRLNVNTHVVCVGPDETDNCCEPEIRSSRCD